MDDSEVSWKKTKVELKEKEIIITFFCPFCKQTVKLTQQGKMKTSQHFKAINSNAEVIEGDNKGQINFTTELG